MIAKLKKKIFFSMEITALAILLAILAVINISNGITYARNQEEVLRLALETVTALERDAWIADEESAGRGEEGEGTEEHAPPEPPDGSSFPSGGRERNPEQGDASFPGDGEDMEPPLDDTLMVRDAHLNGRRALSLMMSSDMAAVSVGRDGKALHALGFAEGMDPEDLDRLCQTILSLGRTQGAAEGYQFAISTESGRTCIALIRSEVFSAGILPLLLLSIGIFLGAAVLFGFFFYRLSCRLVAPVENTIREEKEFIANAGHELKTPVAVIRANADVLEKENGPSKWLDYIHTETGRMTDLITQMLQLSRLDWEINAPVRSERAPECDLYSPVMEAALPFESAVYESGCTLDIDAAEGVRARVSPEDAGQMTGILLDNAVKHAGKGGKILLELRRGKNGAELSVSNTGKPIPEEDLPRLFERFYRSDPSRKYDTGTFGLGLSILKSLAEKNRGTVECTSDEKETRFTVRLPDADKKS